MNLDTDVGQLLDRRYDYLLDVLAEFARQWTPQLETAASRRALYLLDLELDNLNVVLDTLLTSEDGLPDQVLGLFLNLGRYFSIRGLWHDKLHWGLALHERFRQGGLFNLAGLLNNIGTTYDELADYETALDYYERCRKLITVVDENHPRLARTYSNLAVTYWKLDRLDEAFDYANRALNMEREQGDRHAEVMSLMNIAGMHYARWEMVESLELAQQALAAANELGDVYLQAQFTSQIATNLVANLQFDEAVPIYEEALRLLAEIDDEIGLARAQYNYGLLLKLLKQPERVQELAAASLETLERYRLPEAKQVRELWANPYVKPLEE